MSFLGLVDGDRLSIVNLALVVMVAKVLVRPDVPSLAAALGLLGAHLAIAYAATAKHARRLEELGKDQEATKTRIKDLENHIISLRNVKTLQGR